ncbi:hypothetical protein A9Q96_04285 [Rhodobacterales bacterium 52_120_T64]|nr:hypothetical protein A9Q96_04285 [Rhodobacterales bacterium 52_120_T64]
MPEYGCWLDLPSPQVAEIMAHVGFDFIVVDLEHGPASVETAQLQMMAIGARARPIVRVPEGTEGWVKRVLDAGAGGVMVPKVESAAQAADIVSWAFYAPKGQRGEARGIVRASSWGRNFEAYKTKWNADGFIWIQIESVAGLENIEEIAAVEGVTQLFFGSADYSADAGVSTDSEETLAAASKVAAVAKAHGLHAGSVLFPQGTPQSLAKLGFTHISVASDVSALRDVLDGSLRDAKG